MKGDPIIMMVRDNNCMVAVTIKDVLQKRIARMSDKERSTVREDVSQQVHDVLAVLRMRHQNRRR